MALCSGCYSVWEINKIRFSQERHHSHRSDHTPSGRHVRNPRDDQPLNGRHVRALQPADSSSLSFARTTCCSPSYFWPRLGCVCRKYEPAAECKGYGTTRTADRNAFSAAASQRRVAIGVAALGDWSSCRPHSYTRLDRDSELCGEWRLGNRLPARALLSRA